MTCSHRIKQGIYHAEHKCSGLYQIQILAPLCVSVCRTGRNGKMWRVKAWLFEVDVEEQCVNVCMLCYVLKINVPTIIPLLILYSTMGCIIHIPLCKQMF